MTGETLINTLEAPGEFDAMTKLRPGEPYFLLLGRDRLAPKAVDDWAYANRKRALEDHDAGRINAEQLDFELRKSTDAEKIGWAMLAFKRGDAEKKEHSSGRATYVDSQLPEETKRRDRLQSLRAVATSSLNNAASEVDEMLSFLDAHFADDPKLAKLAKAARKTMAAMQQLADDAKPWRPIGIPKK